MANVNVSQKEEANISRTVPGEDSGCTHQCAGIVSNAIRDDVELSRVAPSSKVGYGGCGGTLPSPKEQREVNRHHETVATLDPQGYVEGSGRDTGKEGSVDSIGHGRKDHGKTVGVVKIVVHPKGAGDPRDGGLPSIEEESVSADGTESKPSKFKLKEILAGHHDHKDDDNGVEGGSKKEGHQGLFSKMKQKIVKSHDKHLDGLAPEAWG